MSEGRAQVYRTLYFKGLYNFSGTPAGIFSDNLKKSTFVPDQDAVTKALLYEVDRDYLPSIYGGIAQEISNYSLALFETLLDLQTQRNDKSLSWRFIKLYYAAYFSCLILMRLTGKWPTKLSGLEDYSDLFELYKQHRPEIENGMFLCSFDGGQTFICTPREEEGGGRSHQATWAAFGECLKALIEDVASKGPTDSSFQEVLGDLSKLSMDVQNGFLSSYRNALNYRMEHGIWYPQSRKAKKDWEIYLKLLNFELNVSEPPLYLSRNNSDSQKFLGCCRFLIDLCLWMMKDFSSPGNKFLSTKHGMLVMHVGGRTTGRA